MSDETKTGAPETTLLPDGVVRVAIRAGKEALIAADPYAPCVSVDIKAALEAAAPLILAADLDRQAAALDEQAEALGAPRMGTSASGMVVVLRDLAEDARGRASVLRGEGDRNG